MFIDYLGYQISYHYFVLKIVMVHCEKKMLLFLRKTFAKFEAEGREFKKCQGISRKIYLNSERLECFFNLFLEVPLI